MEQLYVIELCCLFVHNTAFVLITTIIAAMLSLMYLLVLEVLNVYSSSHDTFAAHCLETGLFLRVYISMAKCGMSINGESLLPQSINSSWRCEYYLGPRVWLRRS